jgi:membrane protease YdiL (CAAX protease family)
MGGPGYTLNVSETSLLNSAAVAADTVPPDAQHERRMRWFEVAVVMSVAFTSSIMTAIYVHFTGRTASAVSTQFSLFVTMIGRLPSLLLLVYVLWRSGRTLKDIGLEWSWKQVGIAVPLLIAAFVVQHQVQMLVYRVMWALGLHDTLKASEALTHGYWAATPYLSPIGLIYQVVNAVHEEVLVRAYLMTEIIDLTGSAKIAVCVSVLLQASYHLYYGWLGATMVGFAFLVFALYFAWARKALPTVVAHWLMDMAIVLARHRTLALPM